MLNKYVGIYLLSVFIASCAQILLKTSADANHKSFIREYLNVRVFVGYLLLGLSTLGPIMAYRGIGLKLGPILESAGYVFVFMMSWIFLKERPTYYKIAGIILIISGIIVANG